MEDAPTRVMRTCKFTSMAVLVALIGKFTSMAVPITLVGNVTRMAVPITLGYRVLLDGKVYASTTSTTKWVCGLSPATQYQIGVLAQSVAGDGPASVKVITLPALRPTTPRVLMGEAKSSRSIQLTWQAPAKINGKLLNYAVYQMLPSSWAVPRQVLGTSYLVTGLLPYTQYQFAVAANNSVGLGALSSPILVTTREEIPDAPKYVTAEVVQPESATIKITWSQPKHPNGVITGYKGFATTSPGGCPRNNYTQGVPTQQLHPGVPTQQLHPGGYPRNNYTQGVPTQQLHPGGTHATTTPRRYPRNNHTQGVPTQQLYPGGTHATTTPRGYPRNNYTQGGTHATTTPRGYPRNNYTQEVPTQQLHPGGTHATTTPRGYLRNNYTQGVPTQQLHPGVPDAPKYVTAKVVQPESATIKITWSQPKHPNGVITGYKVCNNFTRGVPTQQLYPGGTHATTTPRGTHATTTPRGVPTQQLRPGGTHATTTPRGYPRNNYTQEVPTQQLHPGGYPRNNYTQGVPTQQLHPGGTHATTTPRGYPRNNYTQGVPTQQLHPGVPTQQLHPGGYPRNNYTQGVPTQQLHPGGTHATTTPRGERVAALEVQAALVFFNILPAFKSPGKSIQQVILALNQTFNVGKTGKTVAGSLRWIKTYLGPEPTTAVPNNKPGVIGAQRSGSSQSEKRTLALAIAIPISLIVLALMVGMAFYYRKYKNLEKHYTNMSSIYRAHNDELNIVYPADMHEDPHDRELLQNDIKTSSKKKRSHKDEERVPLEEHDELALV
ncbi:predicted protein [Nematostella vectensis]|uniref:Fibronectin type-III domain-containing protein n=1 Tax=Nematostella vectensis TaxID=45351 RepID=A7S317_NEMVE|nr:predicted protein [Nematostella vectensis]|eukprot:XP_001633943.1 predicted protein [Nematostella vectensis]